MVDDSLNMVRLLVLMLVLTSVVVLSTVLVTGVVSAEGCCITYQDCFSQSAQIPDSQTCEGFGGVWKGDACDEIDQCVTGCCCEDENSGQQTNYYGCEQLNGATGDMNSLPYMFKQEKDCSPAVCGSAPPPASQHYDISGDLLDVDGKIITGVDIIVKLNDADYASIEKTSSDGTYEFTDVLGGPLKIYSLEAEYTDADGKDCYGSVPYHNLLDDWDQNITITCEGEVTPPEGTCVAVWTAVWDDGIRSEKGCGTPRDIELVSLSDESACDSLYGCSMDNPNNCPDKPGWTYCAPPSDLCDNGKLDPGEDCEPPNNNDVKTCSDFSPLFNNDAKVGCDANCHYDFSNCASCPTAQEAENKCTSDTLCNNCPDVCAGTAFCTQSTDCFLGPEIVSVEHQKGITDFKVTWAIHDYDMACVDYLDKFVITRCEAGDGEECVGATESQDVQAKENGAPRQEIFNNIKSGIYIIDEGLTPDTKYCYEVSAVYTDPLTGEVKTLTSDDKKCLVMGVSECVHDCVGTRDADGVCQDDHTNMEFCGEDDPAAKYHCDEKNQLVTDDSCDHGACIGPNANGEVSCVDSTVCDSCNSVYGMFSYLGMTGLRVPYMDAQVPCNQEPIIGRADNPVVPACYVEKTKTIADKYDSCDKVKSCYDYKSETTCTTNPCNTFFTEDCEWHPLGDVGAETGLGVCTPPEGKDELEDCARCDRDDSVSPACFEELCSLYSVNEDNPTCFFVERGGVGRCVNEKQVWCNDYKTEEDCVGSGATSYNYHLGTDADGNDENYAVYGVETNTSFNNTKWRSFKRELIGNDNSRVTYSNDKYGLGDCMWVPETNIDGKNIVGSACVKNADGFMWSIKNSKSIQDDCDAHHPDDRKFTTTYTETDCREDHKPPKTIISWKTNPTDWGETNPVYPAKEGLSFNYEVTDNKAGPKDLKTLFSLYPKGGFNVTTIQNHPEKNYCDQFGGTLSSVCYLVKYQTYSYRWSCEGFDQAKDKDSQFDLWKYQCQQDPSKIEDYPSKTYDELVTSKLFGSGEYIMKYFSEDLGFNVEKVGSKTLLMDDQPPILRLLKEKQTPKQDGEDIFFSNLEINFSLTEKHGPIICEVSFKQNPTICSGADCVDASEEVLLKSGEYHVMTYYNLKDDLYLFNLTCHDGLNNKFSYVVTENIEADKSITEPQPEPLSASDNIFKTTDIPISVKTSRQASCSYAFTTDEKAEFPISGGYFLKKGDCGSVSGLTRCSCDSDQNTPDCDEVIRGSECVDEAFLSAYCGGGGAGYIYSSLDRGFEDHNTPLDGKYLHDKTLTVQENHVYTLFTGCDFGNNEVTEGKPGDIIIFSVDQDPPEVYLLNATDPTNPVRYNPTGPVDSVKLSFDCSDYNDDLVIKNKEADGSITEIPMYFGVDKVNYCFGPYDPSFKEGDSTPCLMLKEWDEGTGTTVSKSYKSIKGKQLIAIYYTCTDKGGNKAPAKMQYLPIKDTQFAPPCVVRKIGETCITYGDGCDKCIW